jgi:hypothetical protein
MALRLIRPTETITVDRLVCTIFGDPGTGKTTLANTAENCVTIDFDRGSHRARNRKDVLAVDSWHDVLEIMAGKHLDGYRTVHVDTVGKCLDFLGAYLIGQDSKNGAGGGVLSRQGWGKLGSHFSAWLSSLRLLGLDVVLIAHAKDDKKGDVPVARLDVPGGSNAEVMKNSDVVGYLTIGTNGQRVFDCTPTETHTGKAPTGWKAWNVPDTSAEPLFLAKLLADAKRIFSLTAEGSAQAANVVEEWRADLALVETVAGINALLPDLAALATVVKAQVKALVVARAKALGLTFDKALNLYTSPAAPPADPPPAAAAEPAN